MLLILFVIAYIPSLICTDVQFTVKNCFNAQIYTIVTATYNGSEVITNFSWSFQKNNERFSLGKSWQINRYGNVFQLIAYKDYYNTKWSIQLNKNIYFSEEYTCNNLREFIIYFGIIAGLLFTAIIAFVILDFNYGFPILFQLHPLRDNKKKYVVVIFCIISLIAWIVVAIFQEEWLYIIPFGLIALAVIALFVWELFHIYINNSNLPIETFV
jgi:hypothetical protein